MIKYFKENPEYFKWFNKNKLKNDVTSVKYTINKKIKVTYERKGDK